MRIRSIKPEFFLHEGLFDLEKETGLPVRLAYSGLWCAADREGRFKWHPRTLKSQILPFDEVDFSRVLDALTTRGFLVRYACQGVEYGVIPTFKTHQIVNNKERASVLPEPTNIVEVQPTPKDLTRDERVNDACPTRLSLPFPVPDQIPEGVVGGAVAPVAEFKAALCKIFNGSSRFDYEDERVMVQLIKSPDWRKELVAVQALYEGHPDPSCLPRSKGKLLSNWSQTVDRAMNSEHEKEAPAGNGSTTARKIERIKRRDILAARIKLREGELQYEFERERFPDKVKELAEDKAELAKLENEIVHDT